MKSTKFDLSVIKESIFTKNSELNVLIISQLKFVSAHIWAVLTSLDIQQNKDSLL